MISSLPLPAPAAPETAASRRPSPGGARSRAAEAREANARSFQEHLSETTAARERRDTAPSADATREPSPETAAEESAAGSATEQDDQHDPAEGGESDIPSAQVVAVVTMPVTPVAALPASSGSLNITAPRGDGEPAPLDPAPLLAAEDELPILPLPEELPADLPDTGELPAERFSALLLKGLPFDPTSQLGEAPDAGSGPANAAEPAAAPSVPTAATAKSAEPVASKGELPVAAPSETGTPNQPATPAVTGASPAAAPMAAEPADTGQLATGRATSVTMPELPARLARLAGRMLESGPSQVRLRLDPPSLGELRIHVGRDANGIHVRIIAQSQETQALLDHGQFRLREELERSGLALGSFSTALDDGRQEGANPWSDQLRRDPQGSGRPGALGALTEPTAPRMAAAAPERTLGGPSGLDARA